MRIVRYEDEEGGRRWGRLAAEGAVFPLVGDLFDKYTISSMPAKAVRLLAPVCPPNILAIGRNYRDHANEMKAEADSTEPLVFLKATTSVIGPGDSIILPRAAPEEVDYEAELAVVIGRKAKDVLEKKALDYVLGYTCANDVSARDCQRRNKQWARGKSFDTFCPLGPVLITPDEMDQGGLAIRSLLNGSVMQESNTSAMIFSVPELVSYLSHQFTLLAGTVILTGTPAGVGAARTPPVFLRPGDEICVEIEGIGRLMNCIASCGRE